MDEAVEAVLATSVFILALLLSFAVSTSLMAAGVNSHLSIAAHCEAEIIASHAVLLNGNSSSSWLSWTPSANISNYLNLSITPFRTLCIEATCYAANGTALWNKSAGPSAGTFIGCAAKFVILDDGSAVKLEVKVG